ncbi:hypothetical protein RIF29_21629 [Crotalaria pallida]|uniref:Uncharacterized protein n=1 Tax=Crotalaria pallida TaxID=3830 RepID=A0AAN9F3C4_CROPI
MLAVVASAFGDVGSVVDGDDGGGDGGSGGCSDGDGGLILSSLLLFDQSGGGHGSCNDDDNDLLLSSFSLLFDRMAAEKHINSLIMQLSLHFLGRMIVKLKCQVVSP